MHIHVPAGATPKDGACATHFVQFLA
ncbi:hypothetical protein GTV57_19865 (plasmid) [Sphingobium xenophagum]|nr:hypothetical protein GTV57_19865 [Sphingobium xenophagum]